MNLHNRLPFSYGKNDHFYERLNDWIGDVFYDILPENGFELRDEQIFMAFQVKRAFQEKKIMFAEAGVGTGKTIVNLLYAVAYARYTGKPAIISCADESLIEQLVKPEGDISKLSDVLDLAIDVRLAKSQEQYLCLQKLDRAMKYTDSPRFGEVYDALPSFVYDHSTMQSFHKYGDRKEISHLSDEEWNRINYDSLQDCSICPERHRCGLTLSRDHYRKAADLIICSHDFYMEHVWTQESRQRKGQLPFLPEHSCVIFDEGHLVEFAAQKALTYKIKESSIELLLTQLLANDIREEFAVLLENAMEQSSEFFQGLKERSEHVPGSERRKITFDNRLLNQAEAIRKTFSRIGDELVFESELYSIDQYQLRVVDEQLDMLDYSFSLLNENEDAITWLVDDEQEATLVIMPRLVQEVLKEKVFSNKKPIIFTSATLSENGSFHYMADSLGVSDYLSFTVESPFDYSEQMVVNILPLRSFQEKMNNLKMILENNSGGTLILFPSKEQLHQAKEFFHRQSFDKRLMFEGDYEISQMVSEFQHHVESSLCSYSLWEGLDIPGHSLKTVVIWSLPFPPSDPVFEAKRNHSEDPFREVDVPYMLLRLRQGIGRLIRSHEDRGNVFILSEQDELVKVKEQILNSLPVEPQIIERYNE